jgi:phosphatidylinositol alpha-mannosyltransferase
MKLRILQVSDAYYPYPSGVTEYVHNLTQALRRLGHKVSILTGHNSNDEETPAGVYRLGRVVYIPMNKSFATLPVGFNLPFKVRNLLSKNRFDIIHLNGPFPPDLSFWALHYSKSVNIASFLSAGFSFNAPFARIFDLLFRIHNQQIHGRIALSRAAVRTIAPYMPGNYEIIPSGVDTDFFNPQVRPRILNHRPRVLYLSRLDERKGLPVLLKAFPKIQSEFPKVRLLVVGKGPLARYCQELAIELKIADAVEFLGFVPKEDLPSYYRSGDLYCSPALGGESFGIVLLEAMAAGLPVVASRIPGYDEVIEDGINGVLVPPQDPEALAQAVIMILKKPELKARLAQNARRFALDHSWDRIARRMERIYYQALNSVTTKG